MKKKYWIILSVLITTAILLLSSLCYYFIFKPSDLRVENRYKNAYAEPRILTNRCQGERHYYYFVQYKNHRIHLVVNIEKKQGELTYVEESTLKEKYLVQLIDEKIQIITENKQLTLEDGFPYLWLNFSDLKSEYKKHSEIDITTHEEIEGSIHLNGEQRNKQEKLLSQLENLFIVKLTKQVDENIKYKIDYLYEGTTDEKLTFLQNDSDLEIGEGCTSEYDL